MSWKGLVTAYRQDGSPEVGYDPTWQFAELAGDVRDPYPMFAGIRADSPVLPVHFGPQSSSTSPLEPKAPRVTSLFTVTSYELAHQVLTDNVRFSSAGYATTIGQVMGRSILQMDPAEHLRHRALVAKAFRARVLDQWSDTIIGATISELIDAFADDGHADLVPQLTCRDCVLIPAPKTRTSTGCYSARPRTCRSGSIPPESPASLQCAAGAQLRMGSGRHERIPVLRVPRARPASDREAAR